MSHARGALRKLYLLAIAETSFGMKRLLRRRSSLKRMPLCARGNVLPLVLRERPGAMCVRAACKLHARWFTLCC
jgi:hypothetical protein